MVVDHDVRILTPDDYPLWDELATESPQGTIFHSSTWLRTYASLISKKEILYGYFKDENLAGGCSVFSDKKNHMLSAAESTGRMTPYGGYILSRSESSKVRENERTCATIIRTINNEMVKRFDTISIINSPGFSDIRPFIWNNWNASVFYAYFFNVEGIIEEKISKKVWWAVRKAQKSGISVKRENEPDLYYQLFQKTFEKHHMPPPVSKNFLNQMIEMILANNMGEMWIARTPTGQPAAAEIVIWDNKCAHRWSAASDPQFKDMGATSLLLFEIFQDLQKKNFTKINLMAANTPSLTKYISSFNPELTPYYGIEIRNFKYKMLKIPVSVGNMIMGSIF